jgi:hypothetical protein
MKRAVGTFSRLNWLHCALTAGFLLLAGFASSARAADYQSLPVVKPVASCDQLAKAELAQAVGAKVIRAWLRNLPHCELSS